LEKLEQSLVATATGKSRIHRISRTDGSREFLRLPWILAFWISLFTRKSRQRQKKTNL